MLELAEPIFGIGCCLTADLTNLNQSIQHLGASGRVPKHSTVSLCCKHTEVLVLLLPIHRVLLGYVIS